MANQQRFTVHGIVLDTFTSAYLECALWSTNDESDARGGVPLDANYGPEDVARGTILRMVADCRRFQQENAADLESGGRGDEYAGHDFWLTRNHHGAGFWDGDWPEEIGERLTVAAHKYGEVDLYVGDGDGLVYQAGAESSEGQESES